MLEFVLQGLAHTGELVYDTPWTLLRAKPGVGRFVCSDRPLTMYDPSPPHKFSGPGGRSSPDVAAALPLSSTVCLRISPRDGRRFAVRLTCAQVDRVNRFTYGFADRYVYGACKEELEALHRLARDRPERIPQPIPRRMVMIESLDTADPAVADANARRGWDRYLVQHLEDGTQRLVSYEVIDTLEDAMKAISPLERPMHRLASLDDLHPLRLSEAA